MKHWLKDLLMSDKFSQYDAHNFLKNKDKYSQYEAHNFIKKNKERKTGLLERAGNYVERNLNRPIEENIVKPIADIAGGFGQGIANIIPGAANLGISGINAVGGNIPKVPMFDMAPHNSAATTGEIASFFAPGGILKALGKIPKVANVAESAMNVPFIEKGINAASNLLGKAPRTSKLAGNALLGGVYAPDNPLLGMGLGAAGGLIGEGVSKGYSGIKNSLENNEFLKKTYSKINPTGQAKEIEHYLSGGTNNLTKNSKELVKDIRSAYNMRNEEAGVFLNYALGKAGNEKIYETTPFILNKLDKSIATFDKLKGLGVGDLYKSFKANPTFSNAHNLQSELRFMIDDLKQIRPRTGDIRNQLAKLRDARSQVKKDIGAFLEKHDSSSNQPIGDKYKQGLNLYREHVAPFRQDKKILDIVQGGKTDIKNLHNAFGSPTNFIEKNGIEKIGHINKIMQDLPASAKNRILFNAIGGNKLNPEELLKKIEDVKSKGFGSYITPEVEKSINALNKKIKNKESAKTVGKITGLGALASLGTNALSHLF